MGPSSSDAAVMDALIMSSEEECAGGMGHRLNRNDAAVRDVRTKLKEEECAGGMGQSLNRNDAAVRDVRTKLKEEECEGRPRRSTPSGRQKLRASNESKRDDLRQHARTYAADLPPRSSRLSGRCSADWIILGRYTGARRSEWCQVCRNFNFYRWS